MKVQKIVASVAAVSLAICSSSGFAQSYISKDQQDQAERAQAAREYAAQQQTGRGLPQRGLDRADTPDSGGNDRRGDARGNHGQHFDRNGLRSDNSGYARDNRGYARDYQPGYARNDRDDDRRSGWRGRDDSRGYGASNDYYRRDGRGGGPDHAFYRGERLPPEYRSRQYVVDDWRGHHLTQPPRGYHWVQAGGDYVLAAIATGLIISILLNQ